MADITPRTAANVPGGPGLHSDLTLTGLLYESASGGLTAAAGGGQANATQLTTEVNRVTVVATIALMGLAQLGAQIGLGQVQIVGGLAPGRRGRDRHGRSRRRHGRESRRHRGDGHGFR